MRLYYLEKMGIMPWIVRDEQQTLSALQALSHTVATCKRCPLYSTRKHTVFARGNPQAKLMIIGEAPGFHEDQLGLPFVGAAGQFLDKMIDCIGFGANDIYIANILKCRPPNNRDPETAEITQCTDYLNQQITLVKPKLLLALGRFAAQYLVNSTHSLSNLRSKTHYYQDIPVMVTYHPAYLLRSPGDKKKAYHDWLEVRDLLSKI